MARVKVYNNCYDYANVMRNPKTTATQNAVRIVWFFSFTTTWKICGHNHREFTDNRLMHRFFN